MWLCSLLIVCSGYCQAISADSADKYPCYIALHGDTVVVFSLPQARHIAQTYYLLDECDSIATELAAERDRRQDIDLRTDSIIASYQAELSKDEVIFKAYQKEQLLDQDQMASMRKQARLEKIKSKVLGFGIGVPVISVVGVGAFIAGCFFKVKL